MLGKVMQDRTGLAVTALGNLIVDPAFLKGVLSFRMQTLNGYDFSSLHRG